MSSKLEITRVCEFCAKEFIARTTTTRFCSHTCNRKSYKARIREEKIEKSSSQKHVPKTNEDLNTKEFLSVRQAAQLLGCSKQTFYD